MARGDAILSATIRGIGNGRGKGRGRGRGRGGAVADGNLVLDPPADMDVLALGPTVAPELTPAMIDDVDADAADMESVPDDDLLGKGGPLRA